MIKNLGVLVLLFFLFLPVPQLYSQQLQDDVEQILEKAEIFFKSLSEKRFKEAWSFLTKKSQDTIVGDVYEASKEIGVTYSIEQIKSDFYVNGFISKSYWDGFLKNFNPTIVLEECLWEKILHKNNYAEIVIRYKSSENPFHLKMYKENGIWKVGFTETFWGLKK